MYVLARTGQLQDCMYVPCTYEYRGTRGAGACRCGNAQVLLLTGAPVNAHGFCVWLPPEPTADTRRRPASITTVRPSSGLPSLLLGRRHQAARSRCITWSLAPRVATPSCCSRVRSSALSLRPIACNSAIRRACSGVRCGSDGSMPPPAAAAAPLVASPAAGRASAASSDAAAGEGAPPAGGALVAASMAPRCRSLDLKSIWNLLQVVRATSEASGSAPSRPGCTPWVGRGDV